MYTHDGIAKLVMVWCVLAQIFKVGCCWVPETAANLTMMMTLVLLLLKKSILDVDFNRKIIKLLHLWPGTFLLLFYFEYFDQFSSYSNHNPINKFADKNFMTRMFRRSTVSWSPSENMWNVLLLRILAPPMLARYITVPGFLIFEV